MGNCGCKEKPATGELNVDKRKGVTNSNHTPEEREIAAATKIQATYRGEKVRKELKSTVPEEISPDPTKHRPSPAFATEITQIPNYSNPNTIIAIQKAGPFIYDQDDPVDQILPSLPPFELENSAVYIGQWKNGLRQG